MKKSVLIPGAAAVFLALAGALFWRGLKHPASFSGTPAPDTSEALQISSGTIGSGGSLSRSLELSGVPSTQVAQIERTLRPLFDPRLAKASDHYDLFVSTAHQFVKLQYWPSAFEYVTVERTGTTLAAHRTKISLTETTVGVNGQIKTSLWEAMTQQGIPPEMIYRFAELFAWRIDFLTEPRQGDTYKLLWKRRRAGSAVKDGEIIAAYYNSQEKGDVYAYSLAGDYFDASGQSLRGEFLRAPLAYRRISSRFTEHRFHPILRIYRPHHGIDYSAARGTPAVSIGNGVVIERGWGGGLGNEIRIRHAMGYVSIYGHLMGFAKGTSVGSHVQQSQVVGYVGSTGLSTGPHLHFGFEHDGQLINFLSLKMQDTRKAIPSAERAHFTQIKQEAAALFAKLTPGSAVQILTP